MPSAQHCFLDLLEFRAHAVAPDRLASMRDISRRKLSRQIAAGKVPPMIKIGKKLYFEVGRISEGLASGASEQAPPSNNEGP